VIYVNGQVAATKPAGNYPLPVTRVSSYIGGSDWGDASAAAVYDAVRIYDYAVSPAMVAQLANMYGLNMGIPTLPPYTPPPPINFAAAVEDTKVAAVVPRVAVLNCSFNVDPTPYVVTAGKSLNYMWAQVDPTDTAANQLLHQGVAILSGGFQFEHVIHRCEHRHRTQQRRLCDANNGQLIRRTPRWLDVRVCCEVRHDCGWVVEAVGPGQWRVCGRLHCDVGRQRSRSTGS